MTVVDSSIVVGGRFIAIQDSQRENLEAHREQWDELADRMVSAGEYLVVPMWWDDHVPLLTLIGISFTIGDALPVEYRPGEISRCHQNVARVFLEDAGNAQIATGYTLGGGDTKWRQHSWTVSYEDGHVIETTGPRDGYFGIVLPDSAAEQFARAQLEEWVT